MADKPIGDVDAFVEHGAAVLGVTLDPAVREAVIANFKLFVGLADAIEGFEEPETQDPAAVFRP